MTTAGGSTKGESGPTQTVVVGERWEAKPKLALLVGVSLRLFPAVVGAIAVWVATRTLPRPFGWWIAAWWLGLGVIAQGTVWLLNRWIARLLPMEMLLRLSLAFPIKHHLALPPRCERETSKSSIEK
jgi:hypothetical protein